jgi:low affinity Fe/Cu permease
MLHGLDRVVAHSAAGGIVAAFVVGFAVALAWAGFPVSWEVAFSTAASAVTLVMVFVVHHTQRREQAATHLKLDELVRAIPQADDQFMRAHAVSDEEVEELEQRQIEQYRTSRAGRGM